jgi:hypothetical protein
MSEKDNQELAFPGTDARGFVSTGMTLRDWFAGQAMAGLCACADLYIPAGENWITYIPKKAYDVADAMMEARKK